MAKKDQVKAMKKRFDSNRLIARSGLTKGRMFRAGIGGYTPDEPVVPPVYTCFYPFVLTSPQAIGFGQTGALPVVDQTVTYTVDGGGPSQSYAQTTDVTGPQYVDLTAGKKVIEFYFDTDEIITAGIVNTAAKLIDGSSTADIITLGIDSAVGIHVFYVVTNSGGLVYSGPVSYGFNTVGIELDSSDNTIKVKVNDAYVTLSNDSYTPAADAIVWLQMGQSVGVDAANDGLVFTIEARTGVSDFTQTYTAGHTDICGNPV